MPSAELREDALSQWGSQEAHDRFLASWPCLNSIEVAQPSEAADPASALTVAAWNIERCKWVEPSAGVIRRAGADVVLATEIDLGMARSDQRHAARDLAAELGYGYIYGVEFVELGTGDPYETSKFGDIPNLHGLHGNAILSRWPLQDVALIPLDGGGAWFVRSPKGDGQYRIGTRMAMSARIETATGPLLVVSVHLESESDEHGRAAQIETLLQQLDRLYGSLPAVIGGDLNTSCFFDGSPALDSVLSDPAAAEPCFAVVEQYGYDWRGANTGRITTRPAPWATDTRPAKVLDWLFTRGVTASDSAVHPALSEDGAYLSDHELVATRISL